MIKVHFFDINCNNLDIEKESGIDLDLDEFLVRNIRGIEFEATDNQGDLDDNTILWFSSEDEIKACHEIRRLLDEKISKSVRMKYNVEIEDW